MIRWKYKKNERMIIMSDTKKALTNAEKIAKLQKDFPKRKKADLEKVLKQFGGNLPQVYNNLRYGV